MLKSYISLTLVVDDLSHAGGVLDLERRRNTRDELCVFLSSLEQSKQTKQVIQLMKCLPHFKLRNFL